LSTAAAFFESNELAANAPDSWVTGRGGHVPAREPHAHPGEA
jgi:hypothetical protein